MRTESQQTRLLNFPYENKRKKPHALHHTYKKTKKNTYKTMIKPIVSTNKNHVTTRFVCDVNHAIY